MPCQGRDESKLRVGVFGWKLLEPIYCRVRRRLCLAFAVWLLYACSCDLKGHRHDEVCDGAFMQVGGVQSERDEAKTPNQPKNKFRYSYGA